jgi:hypothetical protein
MLAQILMDVRVLSSSREAMLRMLLTTTSQVTATFQAVQTLLDAMHINGRCISGLRDSQFHAVTGDRIIEETTPQMLVRDQAIEVKMIDSLVKKRERGVKPFGLHSNG